MGWGNARRESRGNQMIDRAFGEGLGRGTLGPDLLALKETAETTGEGLGTALAGAMGLKAKDIPACVSLALFRETLPKLDVYRDMPHLRGVMVQKAIETAKAAGHDLGEFLPGWGDAGFCEKHLAAYLGGKELPRSLAPMRFGRKGKR